MLKWSAPTLYSCSWFLFLFPRTFRNKPNQKKKKNDLKRIMTTLLVFFFVVLNKLLNDGLQCLTYCIKCRLSLCLFISCDVCHYSGFSFSVWWEKGLMLLELCLGQIKWQNRNAHRRNAFTAYYIEYAEKSKTSRNFKRKSVCYLRPAEFTSGVNKVSVACSSNCWTKKQLF